jgi:hypothetical protein
MTDVAITAVKENISSQQASVDSAIRVSQELRNRKPATPNGAE